MSKDSLGKGLEGLLPTNFDNALLLGSEERIQNLFIKAVHPNAGQPRKNFDQASLTELADSIKEHGVLQPIIVSPLSGDSYEIIAGERRWRAATIAKLKTIPAIVREQAAVERLEIALIENVQRVDLAPLEQALSIERLHQQFNFSYQAIADRLGKAHSTVHNIVRLLNLPQDARNALQDGLISEGHARTILSLNGTPEKQAELLDFIVKNGWTVRQAEQFVTSVKKGVEAKKAHKATAAETPQTKSLSKKLHTKVTVKRTAKGGRLEIHYKDDDELEVLLQRFDKV